MAPQLWSEVEALHRAADAHVNAGDVETGRTLSEQALHLAFQHAGPEDPGVAACFLHLGRIEEGAGDLTGAEPRYNAACSILKPTEGDATPLKAEVLLAYGSLYAKMKLGWRAILLLEHAKARFVELAGPDDQHVGRCCAMLAVSHEGVELEDEAMAHYDEALRILSPAWGVTHPFVEYLGWGRADLAFWRAMKREDAAGVTQALAGFRAGLARLEDTAGRDHPDAARRRATLGSYLVVNHQYDEGARLLADAIGVLDAAGEEVAAYCRQLATARARLGDGAGALAWLRRSIHDDPIGHWVAHGSDRERMSALALVHRHLAEYLDLVVLAGTDDPGVVEEACNLVLSRKALGAELLARQRQAVSRGDDPELASLMARLAERRAERAEASLAGREGSGETSAEIERLEWELASRIPEMDLGPGLAAFTQASAAALLPDDSVLIEFVRFARVVTARVDADAVEDGSRDWYVAFVIPAGAGGGLRLVDLGAAPEIDGLIHDYRSTIARASVTPAPDTPRRDFAPVQDEGGDDTGAVGDALRQRLVDPLRAVIGPRTRLVIAPDGDVARVPFEALPDGAGGYLIDTLDISYVSAGRDLQHLASGSASAAAGAPLVLADPDYDVRQQPAPRSEGDRALVRRDGAGRDLHFARLPGTRDEAIAVAALLGVEPLLGEAASEERLKEARSPRVLHVATHGFFLPAPSAQAGADAGPAGAHLVTAAQNPLVRSGLALAGANAWLRGEALPMDADDGVVTGEDIVALDLSATELVVLSACETGLGDLVAGEGVMGLRRAFAVAGARTLILSLWKVPDLQTRMLMTYFYEALLDGRGRAESLRAAQRRVRAAYPEPFYWAAFICQGDPTPLPDVARGKTAGAGAKTPARERGAR